MSKQTIRRGKHDKENPYFMLCREAAQDRNLSYEARGMLTYLLSKPGDWEVQVDDLILGKGKAGRAKVYSILTELAANRYVKKAQKYQDKQGKWRWTPYEIYEKPYDDIPYTDEPHTVKPNTEKQHTLQNRELQNTEPQKIEERVAAAVLVEKPVAPAKDTFSLPLPNPRILDDFMLQNMAEPLLFKAYREAWPATAKPTRPTKAEKLQALELEQDGYTAEEVTALTRKKLSEGKTKYPFGWMVSDLPGYRLEKAAKVLPLKPTAKSANPADYDMTAGWDYTSTPAITLGAKPS